MTKIDEIVDVELLASEMEAGYIRARHHPKFPELVIYNYTEAVQFEKRWNDATRLCRGLIVNMGTREVLARPFSKFHNWDEPEAPSVAWHQVLYHAADKADGSLGILYRLPDGRPAIATRGSFESEQAIHATELLHASGMAWEFDEAFDSGYTQLFEIIYPENRIVIDYGGADMLIKLGMIHIETGAFIPNSPGPKRTFADLQGDLSRTNAEGWVAWVSAYKAVKIKQADYVELHRIVTGLNRKSIWRALKDQTFPALMNQLPDELYKWAEEVAADLQNEYMETYGKVMDYARQFHYITEQKEFALAVQREVADTRLRGLVFSFRAKKDIRESIYKMIEPKGGDR